MQMNRRQAIGCAALLATTGVAAGAEAERIFAVRRDAANSDDAVHDALERAIRSGGGTIQLPAGTYRFAKPLEIRLPPGVGVAIRGDGPEMSRLVWEGEQGGIDVRFTPQGGAIIVEGMSLLRAGRFADSAVRLVSEGGTSPAPKKLVRDLVIGGANTGGWARGVDAVECTFLTIDDVDFRGGGEKQGATAIRFSGEHDPVDNYVSRLRVTSAQTGVEVVGTCEGVYVNQSTMIGVERGVHWHTTHGEPLLALSGCHVAASRDCVFGHNLIQPIITGNLLYQSPDGGEGEWAGIRLSADQPSIYDLLQVCDNTIHGFPKPPGPRIGIAIQSRQGGLIRGNVIQGADTGIVLDEGSSELKVLDNLVRNSRDVDVRDRGKGNIVRRA
jgi:hypothetical protein